MRARSSSCRSPRRCSSRPTRGRTGCTGGSRSSRRESVCRYAERVPRRPGLRVHRRGWRDTTSVYGPAFTLASEPIARAAGESEDAAAWLFKALAALPRARPVALARLSRASGVRRGVRGLEPAARRPSRGGGAQRAWVAFLVVGALAWRPRDGGALGRSVGARRAREVGADRLSRTVGAVRTRGRRAVALGAAAAAAAVAVVATLRYGTDWLAVFRPSPATWSARRATPCPHRLEQLGLPDSVALGVAQRLLPSPSSSSRGGLPPAARPSAAPPLRSSPRRTWPLVPGLGRAAGGGRRRPEPRRSSASRSAPTCCPRRFRPEEGWRNTVCAASSISQLGSAEDQHPVVVDDEAPAEDRPEAAPPRAGSGARSAASRRARPARSVDGDQRVLDDRGS